MITSVIDDSPSSLMVAVEENLHGHVAFVQKHLDGMHVDESPELIIVDSGLTSRKLVSVSDVTNGPATCS